jgi:hypothetical protein
MYSENAAFRGYNGREIDRLRLGFDLGNLSFVIVICHSQSTDRAVTYLWWKLL